VSEQAELLLGGGEEYLGMLIYRPRRKAASPAYLLASNGIVVTECLGGAACSEACKQLCKAKDDGRCGA
jgi:hypothetical protein